METKYHKIQITDHDSSNVFHPVTDSTVVYHGKSIVSDMLDDLVDKVSGNTTSITNHQLSIKGIKDNLQSTTDRVSSTEDDLGNLKKVTDDLQSIINQTPSSALYLDNNMTEDTKAGSYSNGITVSSVGRKAMPTFDTEGILVTFKTGLSSNAGQLFIDFHGGVHGRKANFYASWEEWGGGGTDIDLSNYITKEELSTLESDLKKYVDNQIKVDSVNNQTGNVSLTTDHIPETTSKQYVSFVDKRRWDQVSDKADKNKVVTSVNGQFGDVVVDNLVNLNKDIKESTPVRDFENGVSISAVPNVTYFPSIGKFGVVITFINKSYGGYGQLFITSDGDVWSRRTNSLTTWGKWFNAKAELDSKADKDNVVTSVNGQKGDVVLTSEDILHKVLSDDLRYRVVDYTVGGYGYVDAYINTEELVDGQIIYWDLREFPSGSSFIKVDIYSSKNERLVSSSNIKDSNNISQKQDDIYLYDNIVLKYDSESGDLFVDRYNITTEFREVPTKQVLDSLLSDVSTSGSSSLFEVISKHSTQYREAGSLYFVT